MTSEHMMIFFGCLLLFAGILGGGFTVLNVNIPSLPRWPRMVAALAGGALIYLGVFGPEKRELNPPAGVQAIAVESGTYGVNCGAAYGNATMDLKAKCNGRQACDYVIDHTKLGDPVPLCEKHFRAVWYCGNQQKAFDKTFNGPGQGGETGLGTIARIECK